MWRPPEARDATEHVYGVNWFGGKRSGNHNSFSVLVSARYGCHIAGREL